MTQIFCSEVSRRKYFVRSCRDANILFGVAATQIFCSELSRRKYFVRRSRDANILFQVCRDANILLLSRRKYFVRRDANMLFGGVATANILFAVVVTQMCCSELS